LGVRGAEAEWKAAALKCWGRWKGIQLKIEGSCRIWAREHLVKCHSL